MKNSKSLLSVVVLGLFLMMSCQPDANKIPPCFNGVQDGNETAVDCGGDECSPCKVSCTDGIQNGDETGVDCGGVISGCDPCPTCNDGIQNGTETGVDCGGLTCPPCPASCDDQIMNGTEEGVDCGGDCLICDPQVTQFLATIDGNPMDNPTTNATISAGVMNISGSSAGYQISLTFAADITVGTYEIPISGVAATVNNASVNPPLFTATSGSIIIDSHNKVAHTLSGTFSFIADNGAATTVEVTAGVFSASY